MDIIARSNPALKIFMLIGIGILIIIWPVVALMAGAQPEQAALAQQQCQELTSPKDIPGAVLINFDGLPNGATIANHYAPFIGVSFEDSEITRVITYGNEPAEAHSAPNVAINNAVFPNTSSGVPMVIKFDAPKTHVGFYLGNGETAQITGLLTAYDAKNNVICQVRRNPVPEPHTDFIGLYDPQGSIVKVTLDYGETTLSESIDDLFFAPMRGLAPTRTPMPTWTPVPTASPTPGPTATPTALVPMLPYYPVQELVVLPPLFVPDLSIHGIEVTQGIQCFDASQGLGSCSDNSLAVVNKKDTTARIYLKLSGIFNTLSNVPVRLHIRANGVWYTANAMGRATKTIDQGDNDSADIYFNVNFTNDVPVDFYAVVDPNNTINETNETNNRYPASGFITLNFRKRDTLKIVGQRLRYHPSGYTGGQYAGGWAVNGGAADWFEQMLPIRNNGVNYSIKSGYLNWTKSLGSSNNQHDLIKTLNAYWILENAFSFWFSGAFTGADHVYGWAPNAGYAGGHADMPVYPHAGGLGVVGIGTDNPGTSTDNPASGALIFGHELVHDYNVYHTNTADACGSNDGNSDFPYSNSSIQEFGFNPITGKIYDPGNTHDLMSYCPAGGSQQGWVSPFTWNKMFNNLAVLNQVSHVNEGGIAEPKVLHTTNAVSSLVVNATIFNPDLKPPAPGALGDLYKIEAGAGYVLPKGEYAVELRGAQGEVLASQSFAVNFESEYDAHSGAPNDPDDPPPFPPDPTAQVDVSFILPWVDGAASVALVHLGQDLDQRSVSANAPQVLITSPSGQESWAPGSMHTITWDALDMDGDPLTYAVFYSADGGASWVLLQGELTTPSYVVDVDAMAGGSDVRFRVVATDGVNTGVDETDQAITIPNQAPQVTILNPASHSFHPPGNLVVLQGAANDLEDGSLPDSALSWSSDVQGGLGVGPAVPLNTLLPGEHVITLTATDSLGVSSSTSVTIIIAHPIYLPVVARD